MASAVDLSVLKKTSRHPREGGDDDHKYLLRADESFVRA
jgi:hypothetical protein